MGFVDVYVEDFNNDGVDEVAVTITEDAAKTPYTTRLMVLAPPDFSPIHQTGAVTGHSYQLGYMLDGNQDSIVDLSVLDFDESMVPRPCGPMTGRMVSAHWQP